MNGAPDMELDASTCILHGIVPPDFTEAEQRKRYATLQARAAMRGIVLVESHTERGRPQWIASLHAMTRAFDSLDELDTWLCRVEGSKR